MEIGQWRFSRSFGEPIQVVSEQRLWGESLVQVWVPGQERSLRLPVDDLAPLADAQRSAVDEITYRAAAARIADAVGRNALVAPLEAPVIPLPHQLLVVSRALAGDDEEGAVLLPTARVVWDQLISGPGSGLTLEVEKADGPGLSNAFEASRQAAENHGSTLYRELVTEHEERTARERAKGRHAFEARRRAIHRLGLPQVRDHRLRQLAEDRRTWEERMARKQRAEPELAPILVVRVRRAEDGL